MTWLREMAGVICAIAVIWLIAGALLAFAIGWWIGEGRR